MSHEIEQFLDGTVAYVGARTPAWHRLGTTLPDGVTAEQALDLGRLGGWDIEKAPVQAVFTQVSRSGEHRERVEMLPNQFALTRINPATHLREPLGGQWQRCVGDRYEALPNEEMIGFLQALIDESGAFIETAGSIHGGADVFVTAKLPRQMAIGGQDEVDLYVVATNNHNGNSALQAVVSPVRVVCANTLAAALGGAKSRYSLRHTAGAHAAIAEARDVLGMSWKFADAFQAEADKMIESVYTDDEFRKLVSGLWAPSGEDASQRSKTMESHRNDKLDYLFHEAATNDGIHGTRWGAYQAVTEYLDYYAPAKGTDADEARAVRTIAGTTDDRKRAAFAKLALV